MTLLERLFGKVRQVVNLRWTETSGVDHSANEEEGWAIMKSADVPQDGPPRVYAVSDGDGLFGQDGKPIEPDPELTKANEASQAQRLHEQMNALLDASQPNTPEEENDDMTDETEFKRFTKTITELLADLPSDEDREKMLVILANLATKADQGESTERKVRYALHKALKSLDRQAEGENTGAFFKNILKNTLAKLEPNLDDTGAPPVPPDSECDEAFLTFRGEVEKAIDRAAFGIPQVGVGTGPGSYAARAREVAKEIEEEGYETPLSKDVANTPIPSYGGQPLRTKR